MEKYPFNDNWYKFNIEKPIRKIVKALRTNGINTFCSCGHSMWIECETYDPTEELNTIYNVLVSLNVKKYKVQIVADYVKNYWYHKHLVIMLPDKNGRYSSIEEDDPLFEKNKVVKGT